jgi:hypothetical protein
MPLPDSIRSSITALWDEYEAAASPEATVAKALDKLETILQHTQGENPADFDYRFNLDYGRRFTAGHPVIVRLRALLDDETTRLADLTAHRQESAVPTTARGTFDVKLTPQSTEAGGPDGPARLTIQKQFQGDLVGASRGDMLSAMTPVKGSAAYVAIERVTGALLGRRGSFVLQHAGTMNRGAQQLTIAVVPDSGTEQLAGLSGTMRLDIAADGTHSYELEYQLP